MEIRTGIPGGRDVDALIVPWFDDGRSIEPWTRQVERWFAAKGGSGEPAGWVVAGRDDRPDLFVGRVDASARPREESVRRVAGAGVRAARESGLRSAALVVPTGASDSTWQAGAEGLSLGDWRYDGLRDAAGRTEPVATRVLYAPDEVPGGAADAAARGEALAEAQNAVRELVTLPGNVATPTYLASTAEAWADECGFQAQAWGPEKLRQEGFGALLAVSKGSAEEPRLIVMEHTGAGGDPVVIVGKGVTFDAGGISIKPSKGMEDMKYDMAGAAATLGILRAAARLGIPRRVIGLVPATENLPSGTAVKPGDVIRGLSGRSIEIINTDAEGRLILSDALTYAQRLSPRAIVDMATLTGACVIALGHDAIGMMTPSDELASELSAAGVASGERVWRLPLWKEYRRHMDSKIADIKNAGGRAAGTITAGWFLRDFVDDAVPWAHLDIAGTAWADEARGAQPDGATGVCVRLIHEWLRARA
ncbi:MAG: leucyl aminopeptidase [Gemmatimonadetes bacterium]|nr:leucyl aminopeptidase [Gemmatimonadota bacterium]